MEDVLEVYQWPHDPTCPVVCLDETSKQLIKETRLPIPAKPGRPARHDYEYERNGTANLFMLFAPLEGWRHVEVTDRHAAVDYARLLKDLSDTHFPEASKIVLVQDNLSTHKPASLYELFPPRKHAVWSSALSGTTPPSTAVALAGIAATRYTALEDRRSDARRSSTGHGSPCSVARLERGGTGTDHGSGQRTAFCRHAARVALNMRTSLIAPSRCRTGARESAGPSAGQIAARPAEAGTIPTGYHRNCLGDDRRIY